jgi:TolA-binding protein
MIEGNLVPIQLQNQQNREANLARLQAIEQNDLAQAEVFRRQIQRLQRNVEALEFENLQLQNQIKRVDIAIREAEKDDARLQISINETRKAIEERNSGWLSGVLSVVISIGSCALATWALQGLGTVIPIPGGAKLNLSFKL